MPLKSCPNCKSPASYDDTVCRRCGASLEEAPAGKGILAKIRQMIVWLCVGCMALFAGLGRACQKVAKTKSGQATKKAVRLVIDLAPDVGKRVYDMNKNNK